MGKHCALLLFLALANWEIPAGAAAPGDSGYLKNIRPSEVMASMKKVANWQLKNPTGKALNSWEYGPFYIGLMSLYDCSVDKKYYNAILEMGKAVKWEPVARPYDANVLAISQVFLEMYEKTGQEYMIDKSRFTMDAPMQRELEPDITFDKNRYWWEWWSWCDALFMAPPAYARLAKVLKEPKYLDFMIDEWKRTSGYLYSPGDSLYYRDDRFFTQRSENGQKIFWSRGNGWVVAGLARVLQYLPGDHPSRPFFERQFKEMCFKLQRIQMSNGFWSQSLLDPVNYPQKESSGTGFFVFAIAWGINNGLLDKQVFRPVVEKGWRALKEAVHDNGKLGYVQEVGDAPTNVKFDDSETYGTGAFLLAGSELYKMLTNKRSGNLPQSGSNPAYAGSPDRDYTLSLMQQIADPVLLPLSRAMLHAVFPVKDWETRADNLHTSPLQAFGRTLSGISPWLSLGSDSTKEGTLREKYSRLARTCLINATDPGSKDYMFKKVTQEQIVHAAYIAYPLLIAPQQLWDPLSPGQRSNIIAALKMHRNFKPNESNWLLFSALIESAIWKLTGSCDKKPIEYALQQHEKWYLGDGVYGDGPEFHWDYYNSYVIHPLLSETLRTCGQMGMNVKDWLAREEERGLRYAEIIERLISPEGTFPVIGRSSVYRIAMLQQLQYAAFRYGRLPASLSPGAVRSAITSVIKKMMSAPGTFDGEGWLNAGIVGNQPGARDWYNYTGALYMCALGLTHLGIPESAPFWTAEAGKWTQQRIWDGDELSAEHYPVSINSLGEAFNSFLVFVGAYSHYSFKRFGEI